MLHCYTACQQLERWKALENTSTSLAASKPTEQTETSWAGWKYFQSQSGAWASLWQDRKRWSTLYRLVASAKSRDQRRQDYVRRCRFAQKCFRRSTGGANPLPPFPCAFLLWTGGQRTWSFPLGKKLKENLRNGAERPRGAFPGCLTNRYDTHSLSTTALDIIEYMITQSLSRSRTQKKRLRRTGRRQETFSPMLVPNSKSISHAKWEKSGLSEEHRSSQTSSSWGSHAWNHQVTADHQATMHIAAASGAGDRSTIYATLLLSKGKRRQVRECQPPSFPASGREKSWSSQTHEAYSDRISSRPRCVAGARKPLFCQTLCRSVSDIWDGLNLLAQVNTLSLILRFIFSSGNERFSPRLSGGGVQLCERRQRCLTTRCQSTWSEFKCLI